MCSSSGSSGGGRRSGGSTTGRHLGQAVAVTKQTASTKRSGGEKLDFEGGREKTQGGLAVHGKLGGIKARYRPERKPWRTGKETENIN